MKTLILLTVVVLGLHWASSTSTTDPTTASEDPPTASTGPSTASADPSTASANPSTASANPSTASADPSASTDLTTIGPCNCPSAGYFPHPTDNHWYCYCKEYMGIILAFRYKCPGNQTWDPVTKRCTA